MPNEVGFAELAASDARQLTAAELVRDPAIAAALHGIARKLEAIDVSVASIEEALTAPGEPLARIAAALERSAAKPKRKRRR